MRPRSNWFVLFIVIALGVLVASPYWLPREIARWYLAAAANAFRLNDRALGEEYLKKALTWDAGLETDGDYWIAQIARSQSSDEQLELLEKAARFDPRCGRQGVML